MSTSNESINELLEEHPSLRHSIRDGNAFAVMTGCGEAYFGAFGIFLQATPLQVGILGSLPAFLGAVFQGLSVLVTEKSISRLKVILRSVQANIFVLLLVALLAASRFSGTASAMVLMGLASAYFISWGFGGPAWNSLIGDLVPEKGRTRFFAVRNQQILLYTFAAIMAAGQILDFSKKLGMDAFGFAAIFLMAALSRYVSLRALKLHDDPAYQHRSEQSFSFWDFVRRSPHSNFARFVFFSAAVSFGAAIAGPYFSLYMLRDLRMSYFEYTLVAASAIATQSLTLRHWSEITEAFGSKRVVNVCSVGVGLVPILWIVSSSTLYLILVQLYAGFMWAGYNLAVQNFMFDAVTPPKRARCAAYQAMINGLAIFCGSLMGGYLLEHMPHVVSFIDVRNMLPTPIILTFIISGVVRFVGVQILLSRFREVRDVAHISGREFIFRVAQVRPIFGFAFSLIPLPGKHKK